MRVFSTQILRTIDRLSVTQLRRLNREFGLAETGNRTTLINRLVDHKQNGFSRVEKLSDAKLKNILTCDLDKSNIRN